MGPALQINHPAPDFLLTDHKGKVHRSSDYRGKNGILNLWSTQCPHAERSDREILTYLAEWGERVVLLSIASNANEPPALLTEVAGSGGMQTVLQDADHSVANLYSAVITPHVDVIDFKGNLRYQDAYDDTNFRKSVPTKQYLKSAVDVLLTSDQPEPSEVLSYGCSIVRYC